MSNELSNDLKEQIRKEAEKEYPRNQVAQMAFMYGCASYAIHKQKAEAYEKALIRIRDKEGYPGNTVYHAQAEEIATKALEL